MFFFLRIQCRKQLVSSVLGTFTTIHYFVNKFLSHIYFFFEYSQVTKTKQFINSINLKFSKVSGFNLCTIIIRLYLNNSQCYKDLT